MKNPLYRAKCARTGRWVYGSLTPTKKAIAEPKGSRLAIDPETIGEYVITRGKDRFTGDVFFEEVEQDEGDVRIFQVLVWLPDHFCYTLILLGDYLFYRDNDGRLDEDLDDPVERLLNPDDFDRLRYKGTVYDKDFDSLCSGYV